MKARRVILAGLSVGFLLAGTVVVADGASAVEVPSWVPRPSTPDCKNPPTPTSPTAGMDTWLGQPAGDYAGRDGALPPADDDPFLPTAKSSIIDHYGFAGLRWDTYDLSCIPGGGIWQSTWTEGANFGVTLLSLGLSVTGMAHGAMAHPEWAGATDSIPERLAEPMRSRFVMVLWIVAGLALAAWTAWKLFGEFSIHAVASNIVWMLGLLMLIALVYGIPTRLAKIADQGVGLGTGLVHEAFSGSDNARSPIAVIHREVLFAGWCQGIVGDPTLQTDDGKSMCAELFKAQAISREEDARTRNDADARKELIESKQKRWKELAGQVEKKCPDCYSILKGDRPVVRMANTVTMWVGGLGTMPFIGVAGLAQFFAWWIVRLALVAAGIFALVAVIPKYRHHLKDVGSRVAFAAVTAVKFTFLAEFIALAMGVILGASQIPLPVRYLMAATATIGTWLVSRPVYSLTTMAIGKHKPMFDPVSTARNYLLMRTAVEHGARAAAGGTAGNAPDDRPEPPTSSDKPRAESERPDPRFHAGPVYVRSSENSLPRGEQPAIGPVGSSGDALGPGRQEQGTGFRFAWAPQQEASHGEPTATENAYTSPPVYDRNGNPPIDVVPTTDDDGEILYVPERKRRAKASA